MIGHHFGVAGSTEVSGGVFVVLLVAILVVVGLQLWALIDAARRGRWLWFVAIWATSPIGAIVWLTYARRRD